MSERERDGRWLVVVFGPAPRPEKGMSYSLASDTRKVVWKVARTAAAAAEGSSVPPGGHALVVAAADVRRFDRAVTAPLVESVEEGSDG